MYHVALAIKILVIVVGVFLVFGLPPMDTGLLEKPMRITFGIVTILYGTFRTVLHLQSKRKDNARETE